MKINSIIDLVKDLDTSRQTKNLNKLLIRILLHLQVEFSHYLLHSNCFALLSIYSIREEVAAGKLKIIDIDELNINRMFYIIHRQGEPDPYAKQFIEFSLRQKF